jgi:hypothetical protein
MKNKTFLIYILLISLFGLNKSGFADVPIKLSLTSGSSAPAKIKEGKIIYYKNDSVFTLTQDANNGAVHISIFYKRDHVKTSKIEQFHVNKLHYRDYFLQGEKLFLLAVQYDSKQKADYFYYQEFDLESFSLVGELKILDFYKKKKKRFLISEYSIIQSPDKDYALITINKGNKDFVLLKNGEDYQGDLFNILKNAFSSFDVTEVFIDDNEKATIISNLDSNSIDFQVLCYENQNKPPKIYTYTFNEKILNAYRDSRFIQKDNGTIFYAGYIMQKMRYKKNITMLQVELEANYYSNQEFNYGAFAVKIDSETNQSTHTCKLYSFNDIRRYDFETRIKKWSKNGSNEVNQIEFDTTVPMSFLFLVDIKISNEDEVYFIGQKYYVYTGNLTDYNNSTSYGSQTKYKYIVVSKIDFKSDSSWNKRIDQNQISVDFPYLHRFNSIIFQNKLYIITAANNAIREVPKANECIANISSKEKCQIIVYSISSNSKVDYRYFYFEGYDQYYFGSYNLFFESKNMFYLSGIRSNGIRISELYISVNE